MKRPRCPFARESLITRHDHVAQRPFVGFHHDVQHAVFSRVHLHCLHADERHREHCFMSSEPDVEASISIRQAVAVSVFHSNGNAGE